MGGSINIESPNMRNVTDKVSVNTPISSVNLEKMKDMEIRPYTFIHNNTFTRNMAYLSGGSVFIRNTRMGDDENRTDELCGIINIQNNTFEGNLGATSQTTGGAVSLACDSMKHKVW
jgi:hypothetical protein